MTSADGNQTRSGQAGIPKPLGQCIAAQTRHLHVYQKRAEPGAQSKMCQGRFTRVTGRHREACFLRDESQHFAGQGVVIDDEQMALWAHARKVTDPQRTERDKVVRMSEQAEGAARTAGRLDEGSTESLTTLTSLSARVAELERIVAAFSVETIRHADAPDRVASELPPAVTRPAERVPAPPPPMPVAAVAGSIPAEIPKPVSEMSLPPRSGGPRPTASLESRVGSQVFNLVGIVALIAGAAWALKLAIEHGYLGPVARVLIGLAAGVAFVLWSERFRRKGFASFSYSLKAVGSAVLYLSLWAAFQLYHLLPAGVALGAMIFVTGWNAFMAWSQNAELLAAYALLGAFATPLLLSTGTNHEAFLFTYLAAIDLATMLLLRAKPWHRLAAPVFLGTVAFFIGWYTEWYSYRDGQGPLTETLAFIALFGLLFALPSVRGWILPDSKPGGFGDTIVPVLLPLANAVFLGLAVYSVLEISSRHAFLAWAMVVLATIYLGTAKVQQSDLARAMHLAISIVFLTVAISLKASGHALTTAWLVEGLLLFWVSTRFAEAEGNTATLLRALSAAAFALGLASLVGHWWWFGTTTLAPNFLNRNLGAAVVALATLSGAAWIAVHLPEPAPDPQTISSPNSRAGRVPLAPGGQPATMLMAALVAVDFVAVLLTTGELGFFFSTTYAHTAFANVPFATALVGLAALAASASAAWRIHQTDALRFPGLLKFAGATAIVFNLLTILAMEREIGALWHRSDANLQRSLAISGFLMFYGVILLAVGFARRSAFTRWQALALLLFTICKVFLYDTLGLSAGYRVASFLGLGAVLMAVSFAYQKDWLHLREADDAATNASSPEGPA
jgi:uncharacterized membrane protein